MHRVGSDFMNKKPATRQCVGCRESFEKRNYKVSDLIPFLPYVLYESILKETNIKKEAL